MSQSNFSIAVPWSIPEGPSISVPPSTQIMPKSDPKDESLEESLNWPRYTIGYLRAMFEANLPRLSSAHTSSDAEKQAKFVYKRGFGNEHGQVNGCYQIYFDHTQTNEPEISSLDTVFVDEHVKNLWRDESWLYRALALSVTEESKSLETVAQCLSSVNSMNHRIFAVGGGALCDLIGFVAFLAQKPFIFYPTTLLAMVDACVGGKTGVNFPPYGKNQIGGFYFPAEVVIQTKWLTTLPHREFLSGIAECIKHAFLVGDLDLARRLSKTNAKDIIPDLPRLVSIKSDIIARDANETGERAILNLGHTLAHALEGLLLKTQGGSLTHGEAVGVGLCYMLFLSEACGVLGESDKNLMLGILADSGLKPSKTGLATSLGITVADLSHIWQDLYELILQDKKRVSSEKGETSWVLLSGVGCVHRDGKRYVTNVSHEVASATWKNFLNQLW